MLSGLIKNYYAKKIGKNEDITGIRSYWSSGVAL
jgi:hypothetical protein